jgi:hypothetical protein
MFLNKKYLFMVMESVIYNNFGPDEPDIFIVGK